MRSGRGAHAELERAGDVADLRGLSHLDLIKSRFHSNIAFLLKLVIAILGSFCHFLQTDLNYRASPSQRTNMGHFYSHCEKEKVQECDMPPNGQKNDR